MPHREFHSNTIQEIGLLDAADKGDLDQVRALLGQSVNPNTPDLRDDPWNVTPLMLAASHGHEEVVSELLSHKAKINLADKSFAGEGGGETALHYAVRNGHITTAKLLLANRANINKVSRAYGTPLLAAVRTKRADLVSFLLEEGANPNLSGKDTGWTPLHVAASDGPIELVRALVEYGANVNAQDSAGWTPFMTAAAESQSGIAIFLLEHGTDLELVDSTGVTSLMWAVMSEEPKLVIEVLNRNAKVNALDDEDQTALDFAIRDELHDIESILRIAGGKSGTELKPPKKSRRKK